LLLKNFFYPKIKILSTFTCAHVVPNFSNLLLSAEDNLKKVNLTVWVSIGFHCIEKKKEAFLKIFCHREDQVSHTGLERHAGK